MNWKQTALEKLGEALGFLGKACLIIDAILLSVFSVWFVGNFLWHLCGWLNRTLFGQPW